MYSSIGDILPFHIVHEVLRQEYCSGLPFLSPVDHILSELSTMTWNVRSMNQGNLEVVKQEMATVNINILGISELKWTRAGEFNSDDH